MKKVLLAAFAIILVFGVVRLPLEIALTHQHRDARLRGAKLDLGLREEIGQLSFLAALSGFRSLVADVLYIQAHTAWEKTEWGRMALLFNSVTALQPRVVLFWDMAAWHMAWNASVAALNDPKQPREALRVKAQREYFAMGKEFLERGIRNNPDRFELHERLAFLYRDKYDDQCSAAEQFALAAKIPKAPAYIKRFAAYALSHCPGKEREAYDQLIKLYAMGKQEQLPTLVTRIQELEETLGIPVEQRIYKSP